MAEPLEAAAKAVCTLVYGGFSDWTQVHEPTRISSEHIARVAIAAYEAEQPEPDLDELSEVAQRTYYGAPSEQPSDQRWVATIAAVLAHLKGETR